MIGLAAVHLLAPDDFGRFAVAFALYVAGISIVRISSSAPLILHRSEDTSHSPYLALTMLKASLVGLVTAAGVLVVTSGSNREIAFLGLAAAMTFSLPAEAMRQEFLGSGRPHLAVVLDGMWLASLVVLSLAAWSLWPSLLAELVFFCWAVSACIALMAVWKQIPLGHAIHRLPSRLRKQNRNIAVEYLATFTAGHGLLLLLPVVVDLEITAIYRAASQNILGPILVIVMGILPQVTYEFRQRRQQPEVLRRLSKTVTAAVCVPLSLIILSLAWLPSGIGELLAGDLWERSQGLILAAGALLVAGVHTTLRVVPLRFGIAASHIRTLRVMQLTPTVALPVGGAWLYGSAGLVSGCLLAASSSFVLAEFAVRRFWPLYDVSSVWGPNKEESIAK